MAQKGLLAKKDSKIGVKAVFAGDTAQGIIDLKAHLNALNTGLVYEEYDDTDTNFSTSVIDETHAIVLN